MTGASQRAVRRPSSTANAAVAIAGRAGAATLSPEIDRFRRLDDAGRVVARQLVWTLADQEITRIVSSPLVRCVESVVPIAESRRIPVESRWELEPDPPAMPVAGSGGARRRHHRGGGGAYKKLTLPTEPLGEVSVAGGSINKKTIGWKFKT